MKKLLLLNILLVFSCLNILAQNDTTKYTNYYKEIASYNISKVWLCDSILMENIDTEKFQRPEPLGYISKNYQRFYIHFLSISKSKTNNYEYIVKGKTKVKKKILSFQGKFIVDSAFSYYEFKKFIEDTIIVIDSNILSINISGRYLLYEDSTKKDAGFLKGDFYLDTYLDKVKEQLLYSGLYAVGDGYNNNQFEGTWTNYKTKNVLNCNWGDFRIPNSHYRPYDLDIGCGEFSINPKYYNDGWENFKLLYKYNWSSKKYDKAIEEFYKKEKEHWWK